MFCKNCGSILPEEGKFCTKCGNAIGEREVEYFSISIKRLVLLSVITGGFYELYWFYKNWQAVKKAEQSDMIPFWRAFFAIFFVYGLFKRIFDSAKEKGFKSYSPGIFATLYIVVYIVSIAAVEADYSLFNSVIVLLVSYISIFPLYLAQQAINFHNSKINPSSTTARKFSTGEIIMVVAGVLFTILSFIPPEFLLNPNDSGESPSVESKEVEIQ